MLWILFAILSLGESTPVRICVPDSLSSSCAQMVKDLPDSFSCVTAADKYRCLKKVNEGAADVANVDHSGLYIGGKYFDLVPIATEIIDEKPYKYQGIALVSKDSDIQSPRDLKGRSSCHTAFKRTVGWQIPVAKLLQSEIMPLDCTDGELEAVHKFFSGSCVPGPWTGDSVVDKTMKEIYSSLCSKCKNPETCAKDDPYAGYEGVMSCLSEGAADVAFTKIPALKKYLEKNPEFAEKAQLLCFEGGRKDVTDPEPCIWGSRPTNAFVAKSGNPEEIERLASVLLDVQKRYAVPQVPTPDWYFKTFLSKDDVTELRRTREDRRTYISYLDDFIHTIRKPRQGCLESSENCHNFTFCVSSKEENAKCQDVLKVTDGRGLWQSIDCLQRDTAKACMEEVKNGNADFIVLDGSQVYEAGKYYDLKPIAEDTYQKHTAWYYSVAMLKSTSTVTSLAELKGLRSCHASMGHTAGWVLPLQALLDRSLLSSEDVCSHPGGMADFFSGGSCAPGADDLKWNPGNVKSKELCKQCAGDNNGLYKCSRDFREKYYACPGALRCLSEGSGDVAFAKHFTIPEQTDGNSKHPWAENLRSDDFKLLCCDGGTASVYNYTTCNLGRIPFRIIMVPPNISEERRLTAAGLLAEYSKLFPGDSNLYQMFYQGALYKRLFNGVADGLRVYPEGTSYEEALGSDLIQSFESADPKNCT